ncbi:hypothetical protein BU23DRAFT_563832 [Bimuria novae-zelandiae CBS 107.79]|uniref:Uncharacterized protein n=1 Tax=Bimuria novae-zelandiae CBS 107.79 TaxID=1447943 RepID=A0A6A5VVR4_9PLEO|nr:hypothetical protein BU23DRAFT_563832 [Bimuria novae-zelandiae CBS 107.79]
MSNKHEQDKVDVKQKNVLQKPLTQHSHPSSSVPSLPSTVRAGLCTPASPIAANMTAPFLDFSSANGLDLRSAGVKEGSRYCIDAGSWKKAVESGVDAPMVKLEVTHEEALKSVDMEVLRKWGAKQDIDGGGVWPKEVAERWARESGDIGGREPKA